MDRIVKGLGWILLGGAVVLIGAGLLGIAMREGIWAALNTLSPYNIANFAMMAATLVPGVLLITWGDRLAEKRRG